jgi:3-hydroxypropanoate dehydrogenase
MQKLMNTALPDSALDVLFRSARSQNKWLDEAVSDEQLRALYEVLKFGPTSANSCPARFVFCRTAAAKSRLAGYASPKNQPKILAAPLTAIIGYDLKFYERMTRLFPLPGVEQMIAAQRANPVAAQQMAFRNGSLQGAYLMIAARALGLDCGPMSGFDNAKVDADFFAGTSYESNFICSLGHGDPSGVLGRLPRPTFDEACQLL